MNPYNWRLDYGLANWDVRASLVASYNYELPFFKDSGSRILKTALGGWQTNGITTVQSGLPFSVTISADQANVGQGTQRANFAGTPVVDCSCGKLTRCVNIDAFTLPALYTYGNTPRNFLRGPGYVNFDWSLFKNFSVTEGIKLQFRWETSTHSTIRTLAIRIAPSLPGSTAFGTITGLAANMRQQQFGLKLLF